MKCRKELDLPLDKKIILHVGSEIVRKNVESLVKAFAQMKEDAVLVRVGTKDSDEVKRLVDELGIKEKVIYRESFFPEEVAKYYSAADVYAFPSLGEGFGLPIIEAMACGCPVITTNYGAMKEVAGDGAILIDPKNIEELAESIEKLLSFNEQDRQEIIGKGLERAKNFTSENFTNQVLEIYKMLLKGS
jgi:glycosyltransferase involved in cell wall biosynthesis